MADPVEELEPVGDFLHNQYCISRGKNRNHELSGPSEEISYFQA
jgi:hypothetical protein